MKITKISLVAAMAVSLCSVSSADSLIEALQSGKSSGEVTATYEVRNMDKDISSTYYQNTYYGMGSVALGYKSGSWNNFDITAKFRAYRTIFESDSSLTTYKGTGDASERFWATDDHQITDFEDLFITYNNDYINVKAGRQALNTIWLNKTHDAINANIKLGDTNIEAIWTRNMGRVTSRDYRALSESYKNGFLNQANEDNGVYKLGVTHKIADVELIGFWLDAPEDRDLIGGQVAYNNGTLGASAQYTAHIAHRTGKKDGSHTELKAFIKESGYTATLAYLITTDTFQHFGMGTTNAMEEGDMIYTEDAKTAYLQISKKFGDLSTTLIVGTTDYGTKTDYTNYETTLWLGYPVTKEIQANLGYTNVTEDHDNPATTSLNQLNITLAYMF